MTTLTATFTLWLLMDPLGNLPVFTSVLQGVAPGRRRRVLLRELGLALGFLIVFLFLGRYLFRFLALQSESVSIAGGLILATIAFRMLYPRPEGIWGGSSEREPFLFPLAVPMVAGPSVLSLLLLLSSSEPGRTTDWLLALVVAWAGAAVILGLSGALGRLLGERGLEVLQRLMGMLLVCLAVQMLLNGLASFVGGAPR